MDKCEPPLGAYSVCLLSRLFQARTGQHDFRAQDVTFTGSAPGALVHSIFFGDRAVWSSSDGIDASVFAANGFMRGLLKGQSLKAGLDIIVNGSLPGPGRFAATLIGFKPTHGGC